MSRYLDPKNDLVFKKIFAEHSHLLISFLNSVLPLPEDGNIVSLEYLQKEHLPNIPEFKQTIADVKCKDAQGRVFIVEMQMNWTDHFRQRLLFGASQAVVSQLKKGIDYRFLQPVYGLGLITECYEKSTPEWYHHYQLSKKSSSDSNIIKELQLVFIELPKIPIESSDEKKLRILWLRFLKEISEETNTVPAEFTAVPEIAEAVECTERAAFTQGEMDYYEAYWDVIRSEKTRIGDSYDAGLAEGKAIAAKKIAINLLKTKVSIQDIQLATGLSEREITDLQNDLLHPSK